MDKLEIGTRIKFLCEITGEATGDHPAFLYAKKGELGTIMRGGPEEYCVKPDNRPAFYAKKNEIEKVAE